MKKHYLLLGLLLVISLALRLYRLGTPNSYYFDEVYHAVTAKAYAGNNPAGYEWWHAAPEPGTAYEWLHPPLGKLFMAGGIKLFGPTAWAWRFPGALFGVGVIWLTYWIGAKTTKKPFLGLLAALLVSLDGLLLTQSRIGMNDIYVTFFMLAAVGSYVFSRQTETKSPVGSRRWLWGSGIMTGLALATKWSGVFVLGFVGVLELVLWLEVGKRWWGRVPRLLAVFVLIPGLIYLLSYGQFWLQGHTWEQFGELHRQIWWYQTHLEATHPFQSKAWEWPLMLRPVWYYVNYLPDGRTENIYNLGNPLLLWFGLAAQIGMILSLVVGRRKIQFSPELVWITAYFISWLPWIVSPRIMFFYHYAPAIPFLALGLASYCHNYLTTAWGKWIVGGMVVAIGLSFVWLLPIWIGLPLTPSDLSLRFWLSTWK